MNNVKTFIIIDPLSKKGDKKLNNLLRSADIDFLTGYCEDYVSPCDQKGCIWYLTSRKISFGDLYIGNIIGCDYKIMNTDVMVMCECNCADVDLPMIEDIWRIVKNKIDLFFIEEDVYAE